MDVHLSEAFAKIVILIDVKTKKSYHATFAKPKFWLGNVKFRNWNKIYLRGDIICKTYRTAKKRKNFSNKNERGIFHTIFFKS